MRASTAVVALRLTLALPVAVVMGTPANAQQIRSVLPSAPARQVASVRDTITTSYTVSGVQVIHRQGTANLVVVNLYLLGGVRNSTPETAGVEPFYLAVSEQGTERHSKDALRRAMARTGSSTALDASDDWTLFGIRTTTEVLDSVWGIFTDRLLRPRLDPAEIDFIRNQALSGLTQVNEHPEPLLARSVDRIAWRGHP